MRERIFVLFTALLLAVFAIGQEIDSALIVHDNEVLVGAERASLYVPELQEKRVALVVNQTSTVFGQHLVDFLQTKNVNVVKVFAPEHGFRGTADAGERVSDGIDKKSGVAIKSLYGKSKKPSAQDLEDIDVVLFDIQDVGVRFYTYISTMHYVMQACAENNVKFMVLDRPNPNGFYVDGPVLDMEYKSFVGMHPVALVHGMTVGEYAQMINEEGWLGTDLKCNLQVVLLTGWNHKMLYQLSVKPSPNLPNMTSVYLYPTLGLFEGTNVSIGRGTDFPFQVVGSPYISEGEFTFTPQPKPGAKYPKHTGKLCTGTDLRSLNLADLYAVPQINIDLILTTYAHTSNKEAYFLKNHFYYKLAGNMALEQQIQNGVSAAEIRASWQADLKAFKQMRKQYLLYPDFE
jgi:uncharacterized protein YbbC (DUF1343 family)